MKLNDMDLEQRVPMTADEVAEFFREHQEDGVFTEIFGSAYNFGELMEKYSAKEVVDRIEKWREQFGEKGE